MAKILTIGETLIRIDIETNFGQINNSNSKLFVGGSELNVAAVIAENEEHEVNFQTVLPQNSIGSGVKRFIKEQQLQLITTDIENSRLGTYYHSQGIGPRNSEVVYDRDYSAFKMNPISLSEIHLDEIDHFHVSGVTAALAPEYQDLILQIVDECHARHITVSYDSNYRMKLWSQKEAGEFLKKIIGKVDILFAGELDFIYLLGIDESLSLIEKLEKVKSENPKIKLISFTKRTVLSTTSHKLKAYLYRENQLTETEGISFEVVDRIGGGDTFSAVILDEYLSGINNEEVSLNRALNRSILHHTNRGDYYYDQTKSDNAKTGVSR